MRIRINQALPVVVLCMGLVVSIGGEKASAEWTFAELMTRLHQEKSKVVSARLSMKRIPENGNESTIEWVREFQPIGDTDVLLTVIRDSAGSVQEWNIHGRSDGNVVFRTQKNEIMYTPLTDDSKFSEKTFEFNPPYIDWRKLGFGFCGDINRRYDKVMNDIADWDKFPKPVPPAKGGARFLEQANSKLVAEFFSDAHIEVDLKGGARVLEFKSDGHMPPKKGAKVRPDSYEWRIDYGDFDKLKLPVAASLACGEVVVRFALEWNDVNESLPLGRPLLERFAKAIPSIKAVVP